MRKLALSWAALGGLMAVSAAHAAQSQSLPLKPEQNDSAISWLNSPRAEVATTTMQLLVTIYSDGSCDVGTVSGSPVEMSIADRTGCSVNDGQGHEVVSAHRAPYQDHPMELPVNNSATLEGR